MIEWKFNPQRVNDKFRSIRNEMDALEKDSNKNMFDLQKMEKLTSQKKLILSSFRNNNNQTMESSPSIDRRHNYSQIKLSGTGTIGNTDTTNSPNNKRSVTMMEEPTYRSNVSNISFKGKNDISILPKYDKILDRSFSGRNLE